MTQKEAGQILAILKAAYPNSYKGMSEQQGLGVISVWSSQFSNIPASVVMITVNKLISTNVFPPTIAEVKERMRSLYWEAWEMLDLHKSGFCELEEKTLKATQEIMKSLEPMRATQRIEPSLEELLNGYSQAIAGQKQIQGS